MQRSFSEFPQLRGEHRRHTWRRKHLTELRSQHAEAHRRRGAGSHDLRHRDRSVGSRKESTWLRRLVSSNIGIIIFVLL